MSSVVAAITGMGCMSPLGCDAASTRAGLRAGTDGIRPVGLFDTSKFQSHTAGQVPEDFVDRAAAVLPASRRWPRATQILLIAVAEALSMRPGFVPDVVIAATTSGGMDFGERFYRGLGGAMTERQARELVRGYFPHQPVLDALAPFGIAAPLRVISNACASGTNAVGVAANLVRRGQAARVMAIGFDALAEMVFAGFDALRASTAEKCRPFDLERSGLVLGEGAAVFLLEAGAPDALATIAGYGCANDNFHLTKPEPGGAGPRLSMQRALADAGWEASSLDYANAHGTATPFNDASEAAALREVCPNVPVSSTKGMTGHALGAAGAIEAAFCVHALQGGFLPPNINLRTGEPGIDLVANVARDLNPRRAISNSFGFGGSNASIVLEKGAV